ncbi:uncharacterized protein J4E92_010796 [Alternaria infectoria]|uniref:uncharacterized protein n=1 Tax=Alternaria infectoria TaxID=45303 RepID=UPI0022203AAF|nr:uncharacterized protein J4E92_010796 [Alternaria infectoria]KAI4908603.1 hypothetical protein J4E92_010796 [Alternaria infectoria]
MYQIIDTSLICPVKRGSEHQRPMARHRTETSDKMTFEPSPLESRNLFIRAPSLDYPPNGPIKIGNVITDMFRPQDPIAQLEPLAEIITMASSNEGTRKRGDHGSARLDASAKLCAAFGSQAKGKRSTNMRTVYDFNNVETLMLERNPRVTEIIALCDAEPKVQYALKRRPIYVITGLKVARGLRYSIIQSRESEVGLSTQGNVTKEDAVQAHLDSSAGTDGTESYTVFGDVILAYRLHVIKKAGWKRRGEADLKIGAGFLSTEEMRLEGEVETKSLSAQDLKHFAEDEGYETGSILMTDDEEAWSMACVED